MIVAPVSLPVGGGKTLRVAYGWDPFSFIPLLFLVQNLCALRLIHLQSHPKIRFLNISFFCSELCMYITSYVQMQVAPNRYLSFFSLSLHSVTLPPLYPKLV